MPDDQTDEQQRAHDSAPSVEVLETDSRRKPIWGIAAGVALAAFAFFVVWRVAADDDPPPSYSSQIQQTRDNANVDAAPGRSATTPRSGSTSASTAFFFALVGAKALVGPRIVWRARRIYRVAQLREADPREGASAGEPPVL